MMSLWRQLNIKHGDITIESIPHSVIRFLWAIGLSTNAIHSEMRPVYGDKCFLLDQYYTLV